YTTLFRSSFLCLVSTCCPVGAQVPAKIVEQYVRAAGGGRALSKIHTLELEGTFTTDDGKSGTFTFDTKLPNRYYLELLVDEQTLIEAYNGKSAWHRDAAGELATRSEEHTSELQSRGHLVCRLLLEKK